MYFAEMLNHLVIATEAVLAAAVAGGYLAVEARGGVAVVDCSDVPLQVGIAFECPNAARVRIEACVTSRLLWLHLWRCLLS